MPYFRSGDRAPSWCELEAFQIVEVSAYQTVTLRRRGPQDLLLVTYGTGKVQFPDHLTVVRESQFLAIPDGITQFELSGTSRPVQAIHFSGRWGADVYGCGLFRVSLDVRSQFVGDPVEYPKATSFDSHYHDYDEYWIIMEGSGTAVVGDTCYHVRPGDCIPIGAGRHHDFPLVDAPVKAAYLEVSACGQKRLGHLWNYMHGKAEPQPDRF
jgi:mannose-6-phosphate isomerase-like protein (cupin superfamily)